MSRSHAAQTRPLRVPRVASAPTVAMSVGDVDAHSLRRQLRRVSERNAKMFDQGFSAALDMVERMRDCPIDQIIGRLRAASGVVADQWRDTAPVERVDIEPDDTAPTDDGFEEDTLVDAVPVELS